MSKKLKRGTSFLLVLALLLTLSTSVFAQDRNMTVKELKIKKLISSVDPLKELENAKNGIIDSEVPQEIIDQIIVEGEVIPGKSQITNFSTLIEEPEIETGFTVRKLGQVEDDVVYSMTSYAREKYSDNQTTKKGVVAYITIYWTDNLGTNNLFNGIDGGWEPNGMNLRFRWAQWRVDDYMYRGTLTNIGERNYFESLGNNRTGYKFEAESTVEITEGFEQNTTLRCYVSTSILD